MNQAQLQILRAEFDRWYAAYPLHVGKLAAEKAYVKARCLASAEKLLEGVQRYRRTKPADVQWCHPRTWLAQGRWLDEVEAPTPKKVAGSLQNWWDA